MTRGASPARMAEVRALAVASKHRRNREGLAFARNWRIANKPFFDAIYGPEKRCPSTGRFV